MMMTPPTLRLYPPASIALRLIAAVHALDVLPVLLPSPVLAEKLLLAPANRPTEAAPHAPVFDTAAILAPFSRPHHRTI